MRLPIVIGPTVKIGKPKGTVKYYWWHWTIFRFTSIVLGNWSLKNRDDSLANLTDEQLTLAGLNEEYLHYVLQQNLGSKVTDKWDNLTRDLRMYLGNGGNNL